MGYKSRGTREKERNCAMGYVSVRGMSLRTYVLRCVLTPYGTRINKRAHELMADLHGVMIKSYHADNGIYAEKAFTDKLKLSG